MNKKIVSGLAIAAATTMALGVVVSSPASAAKRTSVTLAFQGPLTGPDAQLGQDQLPGAEFAIALYNAKNPAIKINLIKADSQCDGTVAANIAPGVAANRAVIGVIGTSCSGEARNSFPGDNPRHPGDDDAAEQLTKVVRSDRVIPMPTHNLTELISALSLCDFFIGADGGALHLAVALNKPCVALFENLPAKLNHWYPWRVPCRVVHGEKPEVASIELGAVKNALAELMAETGK